MIKPDWSESRELYEDFDRTIKNIGFSSDLLYINNDNIVKPFTDFVDYNNVKTIYAINKNLCKIPDDFYSCINLEHLYLNRNNITHINLSLFPKLKTLNIDNNCFICVCCFL